MSTSINLQKAEFPRRLFRLPSLVFGSDTPREIYVTKEVLDAVSPPFPAGLRGERLAEFRQTLDAFSELGEFSVAENPRHKPWDAMLARVEPVADEFWSIRITEPEETPGIRCLGTFLDYEKFVGLTWDYRENIGVQFDDEVATVKAAWHETFGDVQPHSGGRLDDYLSNYFSV